MQGAIVSAVMHLILFGLVGLLLLVLGAILFQLKRRADENTRQFSKILEGLNALRQDLHKHLEGK